MCIRDSYNLQVLLDECDRLFFESSRATVEPSLNLIEALCESIISLMLLTDPRTNGCIKKLTIQNSKQVDGGLVAKLKLREPPREVGLSYGYMDCHGLLPGLHGVVLLVKHL